jgi:hypothetical protein
MLMQYYVVPSRVLTYCGPATRVQTLLRCMGLNLAHSFHQPVGQRQHHLGSGP